MTRQAIYDRVVAGVLDRLRDGVAPWHQPWAGTVAPCNAVTKRPYSGVNLLALGLQGKSPYWMTYKQAQQSGWQVRAGARGVPILFVSRQASAPVHDETDEAQRSRVILRQYHVFNSQDVDGIPPERLAAPVSEWTPLEAAQTLIANVRPVPVIRHGGDRAYFSPSDDTITLPPHASFALADDYAATAFHELTHWTGHITRLNRPTLTQAAKFGDANYSDEELVAEMGAGFLCAMTGVNNQAMDRSAAYLANWLKVLSGSPSLIVKAASQAQRAVDYLAPNANTAEAGL